MEVIELVDEMQSICEKLRQDNRRVRLIPTMGALHTGHASLIEAAVHDPLEDVTSTNEDNNNSIANVQFTEAKMDRQSPVIIVSIFTNPTQFDIPSDYDHYPKTNEADLKLCRECLVDYVFMPSCHEIYPSLDRNNSSQYSDTCAIEPPFELNNDLEGCSRKGHFRGMLTIVCKLFNITRPHDAYFGEKDYQQLILVDKMTKDLNMNTRIRPVPTVRDFDKLPLSSRNVRMSDNERAVAPFMCLVLQDAKRVLESTNNNNLSIKHLDNLLMATLLTGTVLGAQNVYKLVHPDYLQLRCTKDFTKIEYLDKKLKFFDCQRGCVRRRTDHVEKGDFVLTTRLLISCIVGEHRTSGIRLLDNTEVQLNKNLALT